MRNSLSEGQEALKLEPPVIDGNSATFEGKTYLLHFCSKAVAKRDVAGTRDEHLAVGMMKIMGNEIYVVDGIPNDEYLQYALIQEIECPDMTQGGGVDAMKKEMQYIPENIKEEYIGWRIQFFKNSSSFWKGIEENKKDSLKAEDIDDYEFARKYRQECKKIIAYLESLQGGSKNVTEEVNAGVHGALNESTNKNG